MTYSQRLLFKVIQPFKIHDGYSADTLAEYKRNSQKNFVTETVTEEHQSTFCTVQSLQLTTLSLRPLPTRSWDTLLTVSSSEED